MWALIFAELSGSQAGALGLGSAATVGMSTVGYQVFRQRNGHAAATKTDIKELRDEFGDDIKALGNELRNGQRYLNQRIDRLVEKS